jgi:hypothetical protein
MALEQVQKPHKTDTAQWIHNSALVVAIICPLAMLLPPRKMDIRFATLSAGLSISTNQLMYDWTGQSIYQRFHSRLQAAMPGTELPAKAQETRMRILQEKALRAGISVKEMERRETERRSVFKKIWMGSEPDNWQQKRAEEDKKALADGKGYSDMIVEQVMDVWSGNWRKAAGTDNKNVETDGRSSDADTQSENTTKRS